MRTLRFANSMVTAQSVAKLLSDRGQRFSPRPWNQYAPETSHWWVVPSPKWPAYDEAKLVFWTSGDRIWAGFHVEKGLQLDAGGIQIYGSSRGRRLLMSPDWAWNRFMAELSSGGVDSTLAGMELEPEHLPTISVYASVIGDADVYDPNAPKSDVVRFAYVNGTLSSLEVDSPNDLLRPLAGASRLTDLADLLQQPNLAWLWIDFQISVPFLTPQASDSADQVDGYELCNMVLDHFLPWVVK